MQGYQAYSSDGMIIHRLESGITLTRFRESDEWCASSVDAAPPLTYPDSKIGAAITRPAIIVPDQYKGLPITRIGEHFVQEGSPAQKCAWVVIGHNIKTIEKFAFSGCQHCAGIGTLESNFKGLPHELTYIGDYAFKHTSLIYMRWPSQVKRVEAFTFCNCNRLDIVSGLDSVESIGRGAFYYAFRDVPILETCSSGELTLYAKEIGFAAFESSNAHHIVLAGAIETILGHTFSYNEHLEDVTLPSSVKFIDPTAFVGSPEVTPHGGNSYVAQYAREHDIPYEGPYV